MTIPSPSEETRPGGSPAGCLLPPPPPPAVKRSRLPESLLAYPLIGAMVAEVFSALARATLEGLEGRRKLHATLQMLLLSEWGILYAFGSHVQNLLQPNSDLDVCVVQSPAHRPNLDRPSQQSVVLQLKEYFGWALAAKEHRRGRAIPHARVPIVKFPHFDLTFRFEGVANSHWVRGYVDANRPLVQPLCIAILSWVKAEGLKDSLNGYFNSYTVTLLVLFYLLYDGHIAWRAVDDDYTKMAPNRFQAFPEPAFANVDELPHTRLGRCLVGFFEFYLRRFPTEELVVQFRRPPTEPVTKEAAGFEGCVAVQDPLEPDFNTAGKIEAAAWAHIKQRMQAACVSLLTKPGSPLFTLPTATPHTPALTLAPPSAGPLEAALRAFVADYLKQWGGRDHVRGVQAACCNCVPKVYHTVVHHRYGSFSGFLSAHADLFHVSRNLVVSFEWR